MRVPKHDGDKTLEAARKLAAELAASGLNGTQIQNRLIESGFPYEMASLAGQKVFETQRDKPIREAGMRNMGIGFLAFWLGACATALSIIMADLWRGTHIVGPGVMLFGVLAFLRGLVQYRRRFDPGD